VPLWDLSIHNQSLILADHKRLGANKRSAQICRVFAKNGRLVFTFVPTANFLNDELIALPILVAFIKIRMDL
jgi:hypothetical protein